MREILFKGKNLVEDVWVYGALLKLRGLYYIIPYDGGEAGSLDYEAISVIPESVCEYTGLTDINGIKIFEDDIIEHGNGFGRIIWANKENGFMYVDCDDYCEWLTDIDDLFDFAMSLSCTTSFKVIGNIHDNPELLKAKGDGK